MKTVLTGLMLAAIAEVFRFAVSRRGDDSRMLRAAKMATWLARPIAMFCAVNLTLRLSGIVKPLMNIPTYPYYANEWWPECSSVGEAVERAFASEGVIPWLPVSLALMVLGALGAFVIARSRFSDLASSSIKGGWRDIAGRIGVMFVLPVIIAVFAFCTIVSVNSLPNGFFTGEGQQSSFLSQWHSPAETMLYAIPAMYPNVKHYWRNFHKIQRGLFIHPRSHPPVASSFVRWIGKCFGVNVSDPYSYRDAHARLRYALGQCFFSSLNVLLVFAIGLAMFSAQTGLLAALLYSMAPSFVGYGPFAPDMNYAIFFHGAILFTWLLANERETKRMIVFSVLLGLCFSMLNLMTFSWCIMTTIFALFMVLAGERARRNRKETAVRIVIPLVVMTVCTGYFLWHYEIDYLTIYKNSSQFVGRFYHKNSFWLKAFAFIGGQVEWLSLLGPLTCSGFFLFLSRPLFAKGGDGYALQRMYLLVMLGVFLIPVLFGPACLKHEVARCWIWMAAVPVVCSASHWLEKSSPRECAAVLTGSALLSIGLRLFITVL